VHQFTRVGEGVMVGGMAGVSQDVPPYVLLAERNRVVGLNLIGLRRRGVAAAAREELRALYERVYAATNPKREAAAALREGAAQSVEGRRFLEFFGTVKRGVIRPRRGGEAADEEQES
jgi:UDP-N-acetylglucosamine acyltransferase